MQQRKKTTFHFHSYIVCVIMTHVILIYHIYISFIWYILRLHANSNNESKGKSKLISKIALISICELIEKCGTIKLHHLILTHKSILLYMEWPSGWFSYLCACNANESNYHRRSIDRSNEKMKLYQWAQQ